MINVSYNVVVVIIVVIGKCRLCVVDFHRSMTPDIWVRSVSRKPSIAIIKHRLTLGAADRPQYTTRIKNK